jgi:hypothetical protein
MLDVCGAARVSFRVKLHHNMNTHTESTSTDNKLLTLGILSFLLYPFTAIPGIVIGKRQATMSLRGRVGYVLSWICMVLFCIHLVLVATLLLQAHVRH